LADLLVDETFLDERLDSFRSFDGRLSALPGRSMMRWARSLIQMSCRPSDLSRAKVKPGLR
jgi:hypothetical protein